MCRIWRYEGADHQRASRKAEQFLNPRGAGPNRLKAWPTRNQGWQVNLTNGRSRAVYTGADEVRRFHG